MKYDLWDGCTRHGHFTDFYHFFLFDNNVTYVWWYVDVYKLNMFNGYSW